MEGAEGQATQTQDQGQQTQPQEGQTFGAQFDQSMELEKGFEEGYALSKAEETNEEKQEDAGQEPPKEEPAQPAQPQDQASQPQGQQTLQQQANVAWDPQKQQAQVQVQPQVPPQQFQQVLPQSQYQQPQQQVPPQQMQQPQAPQQSQVPMIDLSDDEDLKAEIAELKKISPKAAWLAQTDTPEGEHVRRRLSQYGPEYAEDYAERIFDKQEQAQREQQAYARQQEEQRRAYNEQVAAANRAYYSAIQQEHADYFELLKDFDGGYGPQQRTQEFRAYQQGIINWIQSKPYAEGAKLMQIAQNGNGPEVCALLTQYKKERGQKSKPDPSGAMAVPNRGAATPPPGIGDQDSLDAGWITNQRESSR